MVGRATVSFPESVDWARVRLLGKGLAMCSQLCKLYELVHKPWVVSTGGRLHYLLGLLLFSEPPYCQPHHIIIFHHIIIRSFYVYFSIDS